MPTATQKGEKISASERRKRLLAQKAAEGIESFDDDENRRQKAQLRSFYLQHGAATVADWWERRTDEDRRLLAECCAARHPNPHLAAAHERLVPELTESWLGEPPSSERSLVKLFEARAGADAPDCDDSLDVATVKRAASAELGTAALPAFPGLVPDSVYNGFVGLGDQVFVLEGRTIARGEEIFAVGRAKLDILMGELRGQLARTSDFRWAAQRQSAIYGLLLEMSRRFLTRAPPNPTTAPPSNPEADAALEAAVASASLPELRAALETLAVGASPEAVASARAARDRLVKKEKKARAKAKQQSVAAADADADADVAGVAEAVPASCVL